MCEKCESLQSIIKQYTDRLALSVGYEYYYENLYNLNYVIKDYETHLKTHLLKTQ